jgi:hypothetical protein
VQDADATSAAAAAGTANGHAARRKRFGTLPTPNPSAELSFAKTRPELADLTAAKTVRLMLDSKAWADVMKPALDQLEQRRGGGPNGIGPLYSCEELESVLIFQSVCGLDTFKETRDRLTSDRGHEARRLLGFDRPRRCKGQVTPLHSVPSEASVSRYRQLWAPPGAGAVRPATQAAIALGKNASVYELKAAEDARRKAAVRARAEVWEAFFARWVEGALKDPAIREQARLLFIDGTSIHTKHTCRITKKGVPLNDFPRLRERCLVKPVLDERGNRVWDGQLTQEEWDALAAQKDLAYRRFWEVTADGGSLPVKAGRNRAGHGYTLVSIIDQGALPLAYEVSAINQSEKVTAVSLIDRFGAEVLPQIAAGDRPLVMTGDAGFTGHRIRSRLRDLGILENVHSVSGGKSLRSTSHAKKKSAKKIAFKNHPNWYTNGHFELLCRCGQARTFRRFYRTQSGKLVPRVEGKCDNCGSFTVTSGTWRKSANRWVDDCTAANPHAVPELRLGNPMTFNDPLAMEYGRRRFSVGEGFHSVLSNRFGLVRGRQRIKTRDQVRLQTAMTFCVIHAIAAEQRRASGAVPQVPPGQAPALAA